MRGNQAKPHSAGVPGSTASPGGGHCPLESTASNIWSWQTDTITKNGVTSNATNPHRHVLPKTKCVGNGNRGEKEGKLISWNCVVSFAITSFSSLATKQSYSQNYSFHFFHPTSLSDPGLPTSIIEKAHWMHFSENSLTIHPWPEKAVENKLILSKKLVQLNN